jgi:hypothetical protein
MWVSGQRASFATGNAAAMGLAHSHGEGVKLVEEAGMV